MLSPHLVVNLIRYFLKLARKVRTVLTAGRRHQIFEGNQDYMRTKVGKFFIGTLLLLMGLAICAEGYAQDQDFFVVAGRLSTDDGNNENVQILILKNGVEEHTFTPPRNGRFSFEFGYNNEFNLTFFKDGYYKKMIIVSTHVPQEVLDVDSKFPPFQIDVSLVKEIQGIDKSFTNKPAGRIYYNSNIDNFDSEVYFSDIQLEEQAANARAQEQALTEEQRAAQAQREADYQRTIARANALTTEEKYEEAITQFQSASGLFPERDYPKDRIAELNDLMNALRLAEERRLQAEQEYQEKISEADALFQSESYEQAKAIYGEALVLKPDDPYATSQIAKADELIVQQQVDLQYNDLISQAEDFFNNAEWMEARGLYEEALALNPSESAFINEQISKIDRELAAQQELAEREAQYTSLMEQGAQSFQGENYQEALNAFQQALALKPGDEQASQRIAETEGVLLDLQNRESYNQHIADAEQALSEEDFVMAKSLFSQALTFLPDENYPKEKIAEIDEAMALMSQFDELLEQAAMFASQEEYQQAKQLLQQALLVKDDEAVRNRVQEMDEQLARIEMENTYADLVSRADAAKTNEAYEQAKSLYTQALEVKEDDYPAAQIREIDEILAGLAEQARLEQQFNEIMANAEAAFGRSEFQMALDGFREALALKPENQLVKDRIGETEEMIRQLEQKQQFDALVARADQDFEQEEYEQAKTGYQDALAILPQEAHPQNQIQRIDQILAQLEAERQREADYLAAVEAGDAFFGSENYSSAKENYQAALTLKSNEPYPRQKISEIDGILSRLEQERLAAEALRASYDEVIERADAALAGEQYADARSAYEEALTLLPEETYPKNQLAEVDRLIEQEREEAFQAAIASGDQFFQAENYSESKSAYTDALEIKPNDTYATGQIARITEILEQLAQDQLQRERLQQQYDAKLKEAELAFNNSRFGQAKNLYQQANTLKPDETYPIEQIAKIDALLLEIQQREAIDQQYTQTMRQAETAFNADQLQEALGLFREAAVLKPEEQLPPRRIADIENLISQRAELARLTAEEAQQQEAILQAKRASYETALAEAERAVDQKEYAMAKRHLVDALNLFPDEQFPKARMAQIDLLIEQEALARMERLRQAQQDSLQRVRQMAFDQKIAEAEQSEQAEQFDNAIARYFEAKEILPANAAEVDRRIELVRARMLEKQGLEASYANAIREADRLFDNQDWLNARNRYEEALSYKQDANHPQEQLRLIVQRLEALEASYAEAIRLGDQFFNDENWAQAKNNYNEALRIKPQEQYPADQLTKISQLERQPEVVAVEQPMVEEPVARPIQTAVVSDLYPEYIVSADNSYNQHDYKVAQYYYQKALNERPSETYPKERLREISDLINRTMSQNELAAYDEAIDKADQAFTEKQYSISKFHYYKALEVKSWEQYPKDQIQEIQRLTNSLLSKLKEGEYQDLITKADEAFIKRDYAVARAYYNRSLTIKANEQYPKIKLEEVAGIVQQQLSKTDEKAYQDFISEGDKAMRESNFSVARFYYQKALGLKPNESYPQEQLKVIKESLSSVN
jgi:tetratricopeptide (TPR) repeat protein